MSAPKVNIKIKFVSAKAGNDPPIRIENPISLTDLIGDIRANDYHLLRECLENIVSNPDNDLYFHKDAEYCYAFDDDAFPDGAIFGLKERRKIQNKNTRMTAAKLTPLKSESDFK